MDVVWLILPLILAWMLDRLLGDPSWLPHLIVIFGKLISWGEKHLNKGTHRSLKGGIFSFFCLVLVFSSSYAILLAASCISIYLALAIKTILMFYCLAGTTLEREVRDVFNTTQISLEKGRKQISRIVGRDTSQLSKQQIQTAALETLSENLSDGVIAPLFWFALLGVPGMLTYKMINTLDSMIGYKTERYKSFGCFAAWTDDLANLIPARLTALLMLIAGGALNKFKFVCKYGRCHASPNSGYPESALAAILNCRFGGPNFYFGKIVDKPYIGSNPRDLTYADMDKATQINRRSETLMIILVLIWVIGIHFV